MSRPLGRPGAIAPARDAAAAAPVDGARWRDDLRGALNGTAAILPFALSYGFIVYGVIGSAAAQTGLSASLLALVVGGLVMVAAGRSRLPAASPSASTALILGGAVLVLLRDPLLADGSPAAVARLVLLVSAIVLGTGGLLLLLGLLRAGNLVRFVPQPVLAGFMNGVAVLIVVSQLPPLLGLPAPDWARDGWRALAAWQGPALAVAVATALAMAACARLLPRAPAALLALVGAGGVVMLWQHLAGPASALAGLQRIGTLALELPAPALLQALGDPALPALLQRHAGTLAGTALLLALIGALESVLNLAAIDQETGDRSQASRELAALGLANIASGLCGGLPLVYLRLRAMATLHGGGRRPAAVALGSLLLALAVGVALPLVERLSTAVVAGVVVMLAWTLVDRWTRGLLARWWAGERSADQARSLAVVALVCAVTVVLGFAAGVAVGVVVTVVVFIHAMNRQLVRSQYTAADCGSRRVHAPDDEARLAPLRPRIVVLELEGALFFGSAERLLQAAEAPGPVPRSDLILDLRRVSMVDATGAVALAQLAQRLARAGTRLRLAGVAPGSRHALALQAHNVALALQAPNVALALQAPTGTAPAQPEAAAPLPAGTLCGHSDVDHALEAAELAALPGPGLAVRSVALAGMHLLQGVDAAALARLEGLLGTRHLAAGALLFAQGDPGDALYLLQSGSLSVRDRASGQRFVSISPGVCFGETAVLDGAGRSADAVADVASTVRVLPAAALATLQQQHPALAAQLYRNMALYLSQRLRAASAAWRRAEA